MVKLAMLGAVVVLAGFVSMAAACLPVIDLSTLEPSVEMEDDATETVDAGFAEKEVGIPSPHIFHHRFHLYPPPTLQARAIECCREINNTALQNCSLAHTVAEFRNATAKLQMFGILPANRSATDKAALRRYIFDVDNGLHGDMVRHKECVSGDLTDVSDCCINSGVSE